MVNDAAPAGRGCNMTKSRGLMFYCMGGSHRRAQAGVGKGATVLCMNQNKKERNKEAGGKSTGWPDACGSQCAATGVASKHCVLSVKSRDCQNFKNQCKYVLACISLPFFSKGLKGLFFRMTKHVIFAIV